jgi:hypothetical protein
MEEATTRRREVLYSAAQVFTRAAATLLRHWVRTTTGASTRTSARASWPAGAVPSAGAVSPTPSMASSELLAAGPSRNGATSGVPRRRPFCDEEEPRDAAGVQHAAPTSAPTPASRAGTVAPPASTPAQPSRAHPQSVPLHATVSPAPARAFASVAATNAAPARQPTNPCAPSPTPRSPAHTGAPAHKQFTWCETLQVRFPSSPLIAPFGPEQTFTLSCHACATQDFTGSVALSKEEVIKLARTKYPGMKSIGTTRVRGCDGRTWRCNAHQDAHGNRCDFRIRVVKSARALPPVRL